MDASLLAAIAACAAAVISSVNVALTAYFARRGDNEKWLRSQLPDIIVKFTNAAFRYEREVFETDWNTLDAEQQQELGMAEFVDAMQAVSTMESFVSPRTATAAMEVLNSVQSIKYVSHNLIQEGDFAIWHPVRRDSYWAYAEAQYAFTSAARAEIGLEPLAVPGGLQRWRESQQELSVRNKDSAPDGGQP